jgi:xanthine dehydrogenase accessory factor
MIAIYERMAALLSAGRPFALATVVRTVGSTPQVVGAKLIVTADESERPFGTLGGGCVEADAVLSARDVLAGGEASLREYRLTEELAWNTGLVCGGTMWILVERGDRLDPDLLQRARQAAAGGPPVAVVTRLRRDGQRGVFDRRAVVLHDGAMHGSLGERDADASRMALDQMRHGTPRLVSFDAGDELLIEPVASRPRVVVAGGGHVAKALARQAQLLEYDVTILEDRPEFADPERFGGAAVIEGDVPAAIAQLSFHGQTYLVIATRGHKLDADCVLAAVKTPAQYIGVLGSRRKTILLADMLREAGISEDRIGAIHAPVGLDLGGRTPAEIALAVMAEITQRRYGGSGAPLRGALGPPDLLAHAAPRAFRSGR